MSLTYPLQVFAQENPGDKEELLLLDEILEENTTEENTAEENIAEDNTTEDNTSEDNTTEDGATEENTAEDSASEDNTAEDNITEDDAETSENAEEEEGISDEENEEDTADDLTEDSKKEDSDTDDTKKDDSEKEITNSDASSIDSEEYVDIELEEQQLDNMRDEDDLFAKYVDRELGVDYYERSDAFIGTMLFRKALAYDKLSDTEKVIYDKALSLIEDIASGNASNTDYSFTPAELGLEDKSEMLVEDLYDCTLTDNCWVPTINESKQKQAEDELDAQINLDGKKVVNALYSDHPELLYWFGRTFSVGVSQQSFSTEGETKPITDTTATRDGYLRARKYSISLQVSAAYAVFEEGSTSSYYVYKADTAKTSATSIAATNAKEIADRYADLGDYEKLLAFKEIICSMVSYDHHAADYVTSKRDSNPRELIYVFDNNPDTNVVCEGYAKAFQYLCDLSTFENDVIVNCVTGDMDGEGHRWNVVSFNGVNYLVDVTNCDTDKIEGGHTALFMKGYKSGDVNNGYVINRKRVIYGSGSYSEPQDIKYAYDSDTLSLYGGYLDEITLSDKDFITEEDEPVIHYNIEYDGNGASTFVYTQSDFESGVPYTLRKNIFTRKYSVFKGWNTKKDGSGTAYGDEEVVKDLTKVDGETVTLYAQWEVDKEACKDGKHSGHVNGKAIGKKYVVTKEATATEWGEYEEICDFCDQLIETHKVHPYETYKVTLKDGTVQELKGYFDHDAARELWELTNKYRKENGLDELVYNDSTQDESDLRTLEVKAGLNVYRPDGKGWETLVDEWADGGELRTNEYDTPQEVIDCWKSYSLYKSILLKEKDDGKTPYVGSSVGCFHTLDFSDPSGVPKEKISWTQQFTTADVDSERENPTLELKKQPVNVTVELNETAVFKVTAKGAKSYQWEYSTVGTNSWRSASQTGNKTNTLSVKITSEDFYDYRFRCVVTGVDGKTLTSDVVAAEPKTKISYYISFNSNGGSGHMSLMTGCVNSQSYVLPACTLTKEYNTFVGWNTKADGTGTSYKDKATVRNLATSNYQTITLYAQWKIVPSACVHTGYLDGKSIKPVYVTTKEATSTTWGCIEKRCNYCNTLIESYDIHPYETYKVTYEDGSVKEVKGYFDHEDAQKVFELTNKYRKENGLGELKYNSNLQKESDNRALECSVQNTSIRPNGDFWYLATGKWKDGKELSVNLSTVKTPEDALGYWKQSSYYDSILLNGKKDVEKALVGVSVGCFHVMDFSSSDKLPSEKVIYTQEFTCDNTPLKITKQPANVAAAVGEKVSFEVTATGAKSYQWQYTTNNGSTWKTDWSASETGTTTNKLTVPVKENVLGYKFRCVIKGQNGSTINSNTVIVKVKPTITKQPVDVTAAVGENVSFEVAATGAKSYQWQFTTDNGSTWRTDWSASETGTTTNKLTVPVKENVLGNKFRCMITGQDDSTINSNIVMVKGKPTITKQPVDVTAAVGKKATFEVAATGAKSYKWMFSTNNGNTWKTTWASSVKGATTNKLTIPVKEKWLGFQIKCEVKGQDGSTISSNIVKVKAKPTITNQPADVTIAVGKKATFEVTATGAKSYKWMYSTNKGKTWDTSWDSSVKGTTTNKLTIPVKEKWLNYQIRCEVTGQNGSTINSNIVKVKAKPTITKQPVDVTAAVGKKANFEVTATGAKSYKWMYSTNKGKTWKTTWGSTVKGATTNKLTMPVNEKWLNYQIKCDVTGKDGSTISSNIVKVKAKPTITKQPVNVTAAVGKKATFEVTATGAKSYKWMYSTNNGKTWKTTWGSTVKGATTNKLTMPVKEKWLSFKIKCEITGQDGSIVTSKIVKVNKKK
ncbi:repeat domain (List_Bact_rpt) [Butyrivibrio sp. YAB3001]|nr:repeat domain (List_Bact_rpt) [Butyrivibrio sp. YAB3001]